MILEFSFLTFFIDLLTATDEQGINCKSSNLQTGERGTFGTNYPSRVINSLKCEWLISVSAKKIIKLKFSVIEKDSSTMNTCDEFVTLFKGSNNQSELIDFYCGINAPRTMFVDSNQVFVTVTSDNEVQSKGLVVQWEAIDKFKYETNVDQSSGCKSPRLQSGNQGSFSSINYPQNYDNNKFCEWLISVPSNKIIQLTFDDNFKIEEDNSIDNSGECYDKLRVFKVSNTSSELIAEYCGIEAPDPVFVNGNIASVTFYSDGNDQTNGFRIKWEAIDKLEYESNVGQQSGCKSARFQSGERGTFSSMNYPQNYKQNSRCEWLISVPATKIIKLTFNDDFNLQKNKLINTCYDSIKVFNGTNRNSEKIGEFCGTIIRGPIFVNNNHAFVTFTSNSHIQHKGFSVQWQAVDSNELIVGQQSGCNSPRLQTGDRGTFSSTNYPQHYDDNERCEWLITVPSAKIIKLTFNDDFDLQKGRFNKKCYDSVNVFNGKSENSEKIGEFCGKFVRSPIFVKNNQAFVTFTSNGNIQHKGFSVQWQAVDNVTTESNDV